MERVIEKLKTDDESLKLVANVLIKQCENEPAFIDKVLNDKKSLNDCWEYIKSRAKKEAIKGCAVIDDKTVFGWAIHYFDEETLEDLMPIKAKVTAVVANTEQIKINKVMNTEDENDDEGEDEAIEVPLDNKPKPIKKQKPIKQKGVAKGQISLFDF